MRARPDGIDVSRPGDRGYDLLTDVITQHGTLPLDKGSRVGAILQHGRICCDAASSKCLENTAFGVLSLLPVNQARRKRRRI